MTILIRGARVIDPSTGTDETMDVAIEGATIASLGPTLNAEAPANVIEARGLWLIPGLCDLSARLREPGLEHKATLESELAAALAGGVTSLVCPPDTDPPLDEPALVEMLKRRASSLGGANVYPLGALTVGLNGEALTEMAELAEAGCIGFSQATRPIVNTTVMLRAFDYARTFDQTVWLSPIDAHLGRGGVAASGALAARLGLPSVPVLTETVALLTYFELVKATGCRLHIARISSAAGIDLVRRARADGLPVTCDVSANHVHLIDLDIGFFDTAFRLDPPLRSQRDRDAIRAGLLDGTIDAICSDHTPVDDDAKQIPFGEAEPGATGLELLLSLTLKWADEAGIDPIQALACITSTPAKLLGIPGGRIERGGPADLCLLDPTAFWTVSHASLISQGKSTPFDGYELQAKVMATFVSGQLAYASSAFTAHQKDL